MATEGELSSSQSRLETPADSAQPLPQEDDKTNENNPAQAGDVDNLIRMANHHLALGMDLRAMGLYQEAVAEFEVCWHIRQRIDGKKLHMNTGKIHYLLGVTLWHCLPNVDWELAQFHMQQALQAFSRKTKTADYERMRQVLVQQVQWTLGRIHHATAVDYHRRYRQKHELEQQYSLESLTLSSPSSDKEILLDDALQEYESAIAIREAVAGPYHLETARSYYDYSLALQASKRFDEAVTELRKALRVRLVWMSSSTNSHHHDSSEILHEDVSNCIQAIGKVLSEQAMSAASSSETADISKIQTIVQGYQNKLLESIDLENAAEHLYQKGKWEAARVKFAACRTLELPALGKHHSICCNLLLRLADCHAELNDMATAVQMYKTIQKQYESCYPKFHAQMADYYQRLSIFLLRQQDYTAALRYASRAYAFYTDDPSEAGVPVSPNVPILQDLLRQAALGMLEHPTPPPALVAAMKAPPPKVTKKPKRRGSGNKPSLPNGPTAGSRGTGATNGSAGRVPMRGGPARGGPGRGRAPARGPALHGRSHQRSIPRSSGKSKKMSGAKSPPLSQPRIYSPAATTASRSSATMTSPRSSQRPSPRASPSSPRKQQSIGANGAPHAPLPDMDVI